MNRNHKNGTHLILGLPGENTEDMFGTIEYLNGTERCPKPFGVKLQLLHVLKGTNLERDYLGGKFQVFTEDEYVDVVIQCIRHLDPDIVLHRVTGDGPKALLTAPLWSGNKKQVLKSSASGDESKMRKAGRFRKYGGGMCGRYYIDGDAIDEAGLFTNRKYPINLNRTARDIYPSQYAPILARGSDISPDDAEPALQIREMRWGFPQYTGKGLFINARSETAMERKTFRESVLLRRCVIISRHFYEWNTTKEKVTFKRENEAVIYMAGFFNVVQDELKFVILTTAANSSMISVHDRMPLILEQSEVCDWICNVDAARQYLNKVPLALKQEREYEQQSLFEL